MSIRWNAYAYAGNNPVNYVDPDGRFFFMLFAFAAAGAILAGAIDVASQLHENGGRLECLNGQRVGMAMLEGLVMGAVGGMMAGLTAGLGMTGLFAAVPSMAMDFVAGATWDMLVHGKNQEDAIMGGIANVAFGAVLDVASKPLMNAMGSVARTAVDAIAESSPWRNVKNAAPQNSIIDSISNAFAIAEPPSRNQSSAFWSGLKFLGLKELPGSRGAIFPRPLGIREMANLTRKYGVEFAMTRRKSTGEFILYSGEVNRVYLPPSDIEWFYHTHPKGTAKPSDADIDYLNLINQNESIIIPIGKPWTIRFDKNGNYRNDRLFLPFL